MSHLLEPAVRDGVVREHAKELDPKEIVSSAARFLEQRPEGMDAETHEALKPLVVGHSVIGYVPEIHGPDSAECPAYKPTRFELQQLARYWATIQPANDLQTFFDRMKSGSDGKLNLYASLRLERLSDILGPEAVDAAVEAVWEMARKQMTAEEWQFFSASNGRTKRVRPSKRQSVELLPR